MGRDEDLAAQFGSEREYFPGSRREIPRGSAVAPMRKAPGVQEWDKKPVIYNVGGKPREFFTIGDLAKALGRESGTIRKWEQNGVIPKASFKTPGKPPHGARRLYSREQIEGMVRIAKDEKILILTDGRPRDRTKFTERVFALFKELAAQ